MSNNIKAKVIAGETIKAKMNNAIVYEQPAEIEELVDNINNEEVVGTIPDKLNYLDDTKSLIKEAIIDKGVEIEDSDSFRSYADKISSIPAAVPTLDVGGKNPVLVKEYHEEIPFSETDYPNITPTTSNQKFYKSKIIFEDNIDIENFDYVVVFNAYIDFVYKEEVPYSSSYLKSLAKSIVDDIIRIDDANGIYTLRESYTIFNSNFAISHKANTAKMQIGNSDGISIANIFPQFTSNNTKLRVSNADVSMIIKPNYMTADAFGLIDTEKTKIVFDAKLYQVDKYTTPASVERKKLTDWVLGE